MIEDLLQSEPESEEYTEHMHKSNDKSGIKDQLRTDQAGPSQAGLSPVSDQEITIPPWEQSLPMDLSVKGNNKDHTSQPNKQKDHKDNQQADIQIRFWLSKIPTPFYTLK